MTGYLAWPGLGVQETEIANRIFPPEKHIVSPPKVWELKQLAISDALSGPAELLHAPSIGKGFFDSA